MHKNRRTHEHLSADEDDATYYVRQRNPASASTFYRNVGVLLILIGAVGYGVFYYNNTLSPIAGKPAAPEIHGINEPANLPVLPPMTSSAQQPQPLADCIGPDNLINEAVATCRFGQLPKTTRNPDARGMVSERYMAQYKADQQKPQTAHTRMQSIEWATVAQWDRKRTYRALWSITDNRIDGSSVCSNWRKGSIEYRECRKGAKVYFREQCKSWGKQWDRAHADSSRAAQQRYCSAGEGFNPLG
ncbi:hypothetical protein ALQ04_01092 [Pseudomonas cichorii]|uniref:Uncharacterized protein n=1 Tax=Pseudomonas cichorii TaxID=36746 RepID=A0A3M4LMN5_PSECI|nr:hypothetical protein [Pseudomonas cichorii]RMQ42251.1 hypothetical protein ALQ04_01092 [Pseudomonas cichorii]